MSSKYDMKFIWDELHGEATCIYKHRDKIFTGKAYCNPIDNDFKSEKIGCYIAELRADIQVVSYECEMLIAALKSLKHVYETMEQGWHEEKPNHQMILLQREIIRTEANLKMYKKMIKDWRKILHSYIKDKEKFHDQIRKNREKDKGNSN